MAIEEKRKKIRRTCYRLLGVPHTAPIGGWKSARERPLFQKKSQGIAEKACWRRRWHVLNRTMEWNFAFTLVFCRGGHWRTMIVERGLLNPRQQEASGSSLFTAKVVSGTRLMTSVSGSLLHWGPDGARSAVDRKVMTKRNEFSKFWSQRVWQVKGKYHERVSLDAKTLETTRNCGWKNIMTRISLVLRSSGDERTVRSSREITENEKLSLGYHWPSIVISRLPAMARTKITGLLRRGWKYRPCEKFRSLWHG